jgi:hypothetical protein
MRAELCRICSENSRKFEAAITATKCHGQRAKNCAIFTKYSNFLPRCSVANQSQGKLSSCAPRCATVGSALDHIALTYVQ